MNHTEPTASRLVRRLFWGALSLGLAAVLFFSGVFVGLFMAYQG